MATPNSGFTQEPADKRLKLGEGQDQSVKDNNAGVNSDYYNYYYSQYQQQQQYPGANYWNGATSTGTTAGYSYPTTSTAATNQAYYDYYNYYSQAPGAQAGQYNQWYLQNGYNYPNLTQSSTGTKPGIPTSTSTSAYQYPHYPYPVPPPPPPPSRTTAQPTPTGFSSTTQKNVPPNPPIPNIPPPAPPSSKYPNHVSSLAKPPPPPPVVPVKQESSVSSSLPTSFQKTAQSNKAYPYQGSSSTTLKRPLYTAADTSKPVFGRSLETNSSQRNLISSKNVLSSNSNSFLKPSERSIPEKDVDSKSLAVGESSSKKFPVSLKLYIENIYKKFPDLRPNPVAHKILADEISTAAASGNLWTKDWKNFPIPKAILQLTKVTHNPKVTAKTKNSKKDTAPKSSETDSDLDQSFRRNVNLGASELKRLEDRKLRFSTPTLPVKPIPRHIPSMPPPNRNDVIDWDKDTVVGTCLVPEKRFFRLTSAPDPSKVRPLHILKGWTEKLLKKWEETKDYGYVLDQFQAVRQDLTVQRIKNPFTVYVYESVGRLCLEKGDLGEFNKCQTQLIELYKYNIPGHPNEFIAYRILYYLHTRNQSDINLTLTGLTPDQKCDPAIRHALQLREAMSAANYIRFFQLYQSTPNFGRCLIDQFLARERLRFFHIICSVFRQTLPVTYLQPSLGFPTLPACRAFLLELGITPTGDTDASLRIETRAACPKVQAKYQAVSRVDLKGQLNQ